MMEKLGNGKYIFVSDLHLGISMREEENAKETLFVKMLETLDADVKALFIVGDLYDYWFEYRRVYQKGFFRTLAALYGLKEKGIKIYYIIGNHDFMHRDFFQEEIGAMMIKDSLEVELCGKKFFLAHGDGMLKGDYGYKILKKILRSKKVQWLYSWLHPDIGISIAAGTSKKSRNHTSSRGSFEKDGLMEKAGNIIAAGFDFVIFGHTHKRVIEKFPSGTYINLGTWLDKPCYGIFDETGFSVVELEPVNKKAERA